LPITPFHHPVAYIIYKLGGKLSLPAVIVGSMVPDLEIPFMVLLFGTNNPTHLLLHSILGSLTVGTAIAAAITILIYPKLTGAIFPINKLKVKQKCKFSLTLVFSCAIGCLSHVLLDVTNHTYNPVFWPFLPSAETQSPIVPLLGGAQTASLIMHSLMAAFFVGFYALKRENFWENMLVG
jgi:membrane-bound metal-dependent hydrolase YbcI (DUF457 family)